jgi:hypothetical protein
MLFVIAQNSVGGLAARHGFKAPKRQIRRLLSTASSLCLPGFVGLMSPALRSITTIRPIRAYARRLDTGSALPLAAHRSRRQPRFHWSVTRSDQPPAELHVVLPARLALSARERLLPEPEVPPNQLASFRKIGCPGGSQHRCPFRNLPPRFSFAALVVVRVAPLAEPTATTRLGTMATGTRICRRRYWVRL